MVGRLADGQLPLLEGQGAAAAAGFGQVELAEGKCKGVHAEGPVGRGRKKRGEGKVGKIGGWVASTVGGASCGCSRRS